MKRLVVVTLCVAAVAMTSLLASVAGANPITPFTPVPGTAYAVDGDNDALWAIPPGGGSPVEVASLPGCYPWGATVVGAYVYWADPECGGIWSTSIVTGVSTEVIAPGFDGFYSAEYLTADAAGNVWATGEDSLVAEIPAATQTPVVYSTTGGSFGVDEEEAPVAATQGYVYIESFGDGTAIYRFADPGTGAPSNPIALQTYATDVPGCGNCGMGADPSGNLYVAGSSPYDSPEYVYEISAVDQSVTLLSQECQDFGVENFAYWSGNLYFSSYWDSEVCQFNPSMTSASDYSSAGFGTFDPEGFGFYTSGAAQARPANVAVVTADESSPPPLSQSITATWDGVPGAVSYTCTLMYGLGVPSSFTVTTPDRTCSFESLSPSTEFGIQVVANFSDGYTSSPSSAFAAPPPLPPVTPTAHATTIVCEKNHTHQLKAVTAVHPHCSAGWHRVG